MTTRVTRSPSPPVAPATTPATATTVSSTVLDNPAPVGTPASGAAAPSDARVINTALTTVLRNFLVSLQPQVDALTPALHQGDALIGSVRANRVAAAPMLANLLRNNPSLAPGHQAEDIEVGLAELTATQQVIGVLQVVTTRLQDTGRLSFSAGWDVAMAVYRSAERVARRDKTMAQALAPIQAMFKQGPRTAASTRKAQTAQSRAAAAQQRTAATQQKAAAAVTAAAHTVAAHNARHPTKAVSPVPLANPQGPAASADVAPQGPAPVPGTGR